MLHQAVLAERKELCSSSSSITSQTGASASNDAQPSEAPFASGLASSAKQFAASTTALESASKRPVETASAAQPGRGVEKISRGCTAMATYGRVAAAQAAAKRRIIFMNLQRAEQAKMSMAKLRLKRADYGTGKLAAAWMAATDGIR